MLHTVYILYMGKQKISESLTGGAERKAEEMMEAGREE